MTEEKEEGSKGCRGKVLSDKTALHTKFMGYRMDKSTQPERGKGTGLIGPKTESSNSTEPCTASGWGINGTGAKGRSRSDLAFQMGGGEGLWYPLVFDHLNGGGPDL